MFKRHPGRISITNTGHEIKLTVILELHVPLTLGNGSYFPVLSRFVMFKIITLDLTRICCMQLSCKRIDNALVLSLVDRG